MSISFKKVNQGKQESIYITYILYMLHTLLDPVFNINNFLKVNMFHNEGRLYEPFDVLVNLIFLINLIIQFIDDPIRSDIII